MNNLSKILIAALLVAIGGCIALTVSTNNVWQKSEDMEQLYLKVSSQWQKKFDSIKYYNSKTSESVYKDSINYVLRSYPIIQHRDSVQNDTIIDSIQADTVENKSFLVLLDENLYNIPDVSKKGDEGSGTTSWSSEEGVGLSVTGRSTDGNYGLELDPGNNGGFAFSSLEAVNESGIYLFSMDISKSPSASGRVLFVEIEGQERIVYRSFPIEKNYSTGSSWQSVVLDTIKDISNLRVEIMFESTSGEIYVDAINLQKYVAQ
jgi:hypothetical protein